MKRLAIFAFVAVPYVSSLAVVPLMTDPQAREQDGQPVASLSVITRLPYQQPSGLSLTGLMWEATEPRQVDWLIAVFNRHFAGYQTQLVRGTDEPEYLAQTIDSPAKILFAHGFFASALHEISHWCVAGKRRRLLNDFGYWYAPDGRDAAQQQIFEQVEVVPQAIECLFTLMCGKKFRVSLDNLTGKLDGQSQFAPNVARQALAFWLTGEKLPRDAKQLLALLRPLRPVPLSGFDIKRNFLGHG